jgi:hypothetical protein
MATNFFENFPRIAYTLDDNEILQQLIKLFSNYNIIRWFNETNMLVVQRSFDDDSNDKYPL